MLLFFLRVGNICGPEFVCIWVVIVLRFSPLLVLCLHIFSKLLKHIEYLSKKVVIFYVLNVGCKTSVGYFALINSFWLLTANTTM